jgi:hypothetical protein
MRNYIARARDYGLDEIVDRVSEIKEVHGVIVDLDPIWFHAWYFHNQGLSDRVVRYIIDGPYGRYSIPFFENGHFDGQIMFAVTPMDMSWRPDWWGAHYHMSNLIVKLLLRPGSKKLELQFKSALRIIQEIRPVPRLSASSTAVYTTLEGGISIGHATDAPGTLGGILHDPSSGKRYALTCGHVIDAKGHDVDQPSRLDGSTYNTIGSCVLSKVPVPNGGIKCNRHNSSVLNTMDVALIELDKSVSSSLSVINIGSVDGETPENQLNSNLAVEFNGRTSNKSSLVLGGISVIQEITDNHGHACCFKELIEVKNPSMMSLALGRPVQGGDSGSWLMTQGAAGNEWCGMIVAEDRQTGYAISSESIIDYLKSEKFKLKSY